MGNGVECHPPTALERAKSSLRIKAKQKKRLWHWLPVGVIDFPMADQPAPLADFE